MAAASNPLNAALSTLEYSINLGGAYTPFGTEVKNVTPSGRLRKVLERRLLTGTRVQKIVGRRNYGDLEVELEYSSATWNLVAGWDDNKTLIWIRLTADDTGGTNGSRHVFKGYVSEISSPAAMGDDEVQSFKFKLAVDDFAFTAGA